MNSTRKPQATPGSGAASAVLTRKCQDEDSYTTGAVIAALEAAWTAIRTRHSDVPQVVIFVGIGSPSKAGSRLTYGHFANSTWQHGDRRLPEVMVSGEGLSRTPAEVMCTLLHEAAHGLATARGIKDTSRQGRWHNHKFAKLATELGFDVEQDKTIGWSVSSLPDTTRAIYAMQIAGLEDVMRAYRRVEVPASRVTKATTKTAIEAECDCGRSLKIPTATFAEGPVLCGLCDTAFADPDSTEGER